jgi:hypothetical protein
MKITGKVVKTRATKTPHGSRYLAVTIALDSRDVTMRYLQGFEPVPLKGQRITLEGMPMIMAPRKGRPKVNVGAVHITIHPDV